MADQRNQADKPTTRIPDDEWEAIVANVPLVSVDLVIRHEGGVLLGFRENEPARGEWFVPGGTVFKNETLTDALYRVADEELGVDVTIESRLGTFEHFYDTSDVEGIDSKHYLATAFEVTLDDDNLEMDTQHSQLKVFEPPYEGLHPYVERYLDALD
ncbi:low-salt glycan biosynthesis hydrolase Agl8 [Haloferax volcanii]|uniref:Low-salt glycan biosynthesis protein Agl8 n=2 Tax=Haloferax volcanii TaxID=2246 RepID=AGL8_HALVD|nr:low-salt glycan biosynthesis hydrolase Agl8 [Haloferax volcanii]D4GU73.1 RecName: Full=Low-salt glycan biosynthesis protein Agl8 [Haloferax volcanii DS2]ADE04487.1 low-salt glycan biosynthesis protein Agl8 [Haloferax volcanii DS2]ELY33654.1 GDP-mannose mannosyl hydrolase [Haloferax volcanii DS2]MBS8119317.1 NUDIX domain-containing protein [Haloferax volcanii]MBS8124330.1 NUDIX domain-containing protein [Haloferax volcanii]MBS8128199.1 NUDIX domain-containing protein [Haloferax volcanii]